MFTGIITDVAKITGHKQNKAGLRLTFQKPVGWDDLALGESIATNGACLTVAEMRANEYDCQLVPETLAKTSFGVKLPETVNLERSLSVKDRFGGHFVQGHVDGVGKVTKIDSAGEYRLHINFDIDKQDLVISKGSITIDGVALTVAEVQGANFSMAIIPHTLESTTLGSLKVGDAVNLEFDMIGKYIAKIMENRDATRKAG